MVPKRPSACPRAPRRHEREAWPTYLDCSDAGFRVQGWRAAQVADLVVHSYEGYHTAPFARTSHVLSSCSYHPRHGPYQGRPRPVHPPLLGRPPAGAELGDTLLAFAAFSYLHDLVTIEQFHERARQIIYRDPC